MKGMLPNEGTLYSRGARNSDSAALSHIRAGQDSLPGSLSHLSPHISWFACDEMMRQSVIQLAFLDPQRLDA